MNGEQQYRHTQKGNYHWIFIGVAIFAITMALPFWDRVLVERIGLIVFAGFFVFVAAVCARQTVSDNGDHLLVRYGPLPVFRTRLAYDQMRSVWPGRQNLSEASLKTQISTPWGHEFVEVEFKDGRTRRIGTDDPAGLAEFLNRRIAERV